MFFRFISRGRATQLGALALLWSLGLGCDNPPSAAPLQLPAASHAAGASRPSPNQPSQSLDPAPSAEASSSRATDSAVLGSQAKAPAAPVAGASSPSAVMSMQPSAAGSAAASQPVEPESREIVAIDWELESGADKIVCLRKTADADARISQFRTVQPAGTHHLGLYVSLTADKPDGLIDCSLLETGDHLIVGAAPGSESLSLPPGVAFRFDKGNQLLLQLHLLNPTDSPLHGRSIVQAVVIPKEAVAVEADVITAQLLSLVVPPGRAQATGRCTFDRAQTLFAFGAHMHQAGRHAKIVLHRTDGGDQLLGEADYDFSEQRRFSLNLVEVAEGDYVEYECSYENATDRTIYWGEGWLDEMCLFNLYRFPAGGETFCFL